MEPNISRVEREGAFESITFQEVVEIRQMLDLAM
jgi:hypothetical protein